jgi:hypothetical protein
MQAVGRLRLLSTRNATTPNNLLSALGASTPAAFR